MSDQEMKQSMRKPVAIGLALLLVGIVIGVVVERYGTRPACPAASVAVAPNPAAAQTVALCSPDSQWVAWNPFRELQAMQAEMDRLFERSFTPAAWPQPGLRTPAASVAADYRPAVAFDVRDLKDRYEVHAALPDAQGAETKVSLDGRRLSVVVEHRRTDKTAGADTTELGRYEQVIQLAGDIKSDGMKVERKDRDLLITIPKSMS